MTADWWSVHQPTWAMIVGGASCVWDDAATLAAICGGAWPGQTIVVNDIGVHWPRPFEHWVTLHPDRLDRWSDERTVQHPPDSDNFPLLWSTLPRWDMKRRQLNGVIAQPWHGGSSGLLAVQVALAIDCTRVVLCGVPLTETPHFEQTRESHVGNWGSAHEHRSAWSKHRHHMPCVRSMSGWTQSIFGAPTLDWLLGT